VEGGKMEFWVILIFIAAVAHATWNLLLKQSKNKIVFIYLFRLAQFFIFFPLVILLWPNGELISLSLILIVGGGSVLLHSLYALLLANAYEKSDYSTVYPTSRGLGILMTFLAGWILFDEQIHISSIIGVCLIIIGIQFIFTITAIKSSLYHLSPWAFWV
jgi:multidrug transporter EmrE-like cation transporter